MVVHVPNDYYDMQLSGKSPKIDKVKSSQKVGEGKTKVVSAIHGHPELVLIHFKVGLSAEDAVPGGPDKAAVSTETAVTIFTLLLNAGEFLTH